MINLDYYIWNMKHKKEHTVADAESQLVEMNEAEKLVYDKIHKDLQKISDQIIKANQKIKRFYPDGEYQIDANISYLYTKE